MARYTEANLQQSLDPLPLAETGEADGAIVMTTLDVSSFLARQRQLEAYLTYGLVTRDLSVVAYDGVSDGHVPIDGEVPVWCGILMSMHRLRMDTPVGDTIAVTREALRPRGDGTWETYGLPDGECMVSTQTRIAIPTPDGKGSQIAWVRLDLHLREAGCWHFGRAVSSRCRDTFDITEGSAFADNCLIGALAVIYDDSVMLSGRRVVRQFVIDAPLRDFTYFDRVFFTSSTAVSVLEDQNDAVEMLEAWDGGDRGAIGRSVSDGPGYNTVYAPRHAAYRNGMVDYEMGTVVEDFGDNVVARQLTSDDLWCEEPIPVCPVSVR